MNRKLSVVVPVYNSEKYLCQCIDSILEQTYLNIEVILIDDGSTDASGKLCDMYAGKDRRIQVIHKSNEGLIKARLSGARQAVGKYITFVDSDDWIEPDTYEQMMKHIDDHDIVMAGVYRYFAADQIKADIPMLTEGIYDRNAIERSIIPYMLWSRKRNTWELDPSLCTKIFKRDLVIEYIESASKLDIYFGEDTAVIFPLMLKVNSVAIMHDCFYYHRQRSLGTIPTYFQDNRFYEKIYALYVYLKRTFLQSVHWEVMSPQLEHFYLNAIQLKQQVFADYRETSEDIFPFWEIGKDADVILYGAGETGKRFYEQNAQYHFCNIILWADQNYENLRQINRQIAAPRQIAEETFDYVIIAVRSAWLGQEMINMLMEMGISADKIVWSGVVVRKILTGSEGRGAKL